MRILFLISTLGLGGAEKQLVAWAELLQTELGAHVSVAAFDSTQTAHIKALERLQVPVLVLGRELRTNRRIRELVWFARKNRADVVHAFSCYLSPLAISAAVACGATPVSSFRGDGLADLQGLRRPLRFPTLKIVKYFSSNSHEALIRAKPHVRSDALLHYVPNLVSVPNSDRDRPHTDDVNRTGAGPRIVALAVGRLDDNKRLDVFLKALARARGEEPRLTGMIVGDGPSRDALTRQAADLGLLPGGVTFLGQIPNPGPVYAKADIFVHLAKSEGTPNVVLEAMAAGLPVLTTAAGDLRHIVRPLDNGVLVPFDNPTSVAEHMTMLARSPELRRRLGEHARLEVLHSFSSRQVRDSLDRLYSAIR
jgi:glycosyltransferase involved in cell wall biosynthesis